MVDITKKLIKNKSRIREKQLSSQEFISNIHKHKTAQVKTTLDTSGLPTNISVVRDLPPSTKNTKVPVRVRHPTISGLLRRGKTPIKMSVQSPRRKLALSGTKRRILYND